MPFVLSLLHLLALQFRSSQGELQHHLQQGWRPSLQGAVPRPHGLLVHLSIEWTRTASASPNALDSFSWDTWVAFPSSTQPLLIVSHAPNGEDLAHSLLHDLSSSRRSLDVSLRHPYYLETLASYLNVYPETNSPMHAGWLNSELQTRSSRLAGSEDYHLRFTTSNCCLVLYRFVAVRYPFIFFRIYLKIWKMLLRK